MPEPPRPRLTRSAESFSQPGSENRRHIRAGSVSNIHTGNIQGVHSPMLTPPLTPRSTSSRPGAPTSRLRSNSTFTLALNKDSLSRYVDYTPDGSPVKSKYEELLWEPGSGNQHAEGMGLENGTRDGLYPGAVGSLQSTHFLDLFGKPVYEAIMTSPEASRCLMDFSRGPGQENDIQFLKMVREYLSAANKMTALVANISTKFSSSYNNKVLDLPVPISKSLHSNLKFTATSAIPSLEFLFSESTTHVENRVRTRVIPNFLKHHLSINVCRALARGLSVETEGHPEYPGMGDAWSLIDALAPNSPLTHISLPFLRLFGKSISELSGKTDTTFHESWTDLEAAARVASAMRRGEGAFELILDHKKDERLFWNLVTVIPLQNEHGTISKYLVGAINVSENLTCPQDVLNIMDTQLPFEESSFTKTRKLKKATSSAYLEFSSDTENGSTSINRSKSPSRGLFKHFYLAKESESRSSRRDSCIPPDQLLEKQRPATADSLPKPTTLPYVNVLVLRYHGNSRGAQVTGIGASMTIAFCSKPVLQLLNVREPIFYQDVFNILVDCALSPTVTKQFKSRVFEKVGAGQTFCSEILIAKSSSPSPRYGDMDEIRSLKRGKSDSKVGKARLEKLQSFWSPLNDVRGDTGWIVLTLV